METTEKFLIRLNSCWTTTLDQMPLGCIDLKVTWPLDQNTLGQH